MFPYLWTQSRQTLRASASSILIPEGNLPVSSFRAVPTWERGLLSKRLELFQEHFDEFRKAVVLEPRGSEELVGGLLVEPHEADCSAGIVFFNSVGMLGMCGHGTIGLAVTLAHLGRIETGRHRIDTPVGAVAFELDQNGWVSVENASELPLRQRRSVTVENHGPVTGQIAWGGIVLSRGGPRQGNS